MKYLPVEKVKNSICYLERRETVVYNLSITNYGSASKLFSTIEVRSRLENNQDVHGIPIELVPTLLTKTHPCSDLYPLCICLFDPFSEPK